MRSGILISLLVCLLSIIAENVVECENDTAKAISSTVPLLSSQTIKLTFNSEAHLPPQRSFPIQKLGETIAPRERGFPFPEVKGVDNAEFEIDGAERTSTTFPFVVEIDRSTTTEAQSDHLNDQNEERRNSNEISGTPTSKLKLTINGVVVSGDDDELPPEVREEDPFAITLTDQSVIPTSSVPFLYSSSANSKMSVLATPSFLINSETESNEPIRVLGGPVDIDTTDKTRSTTSSVPDQETVTGKITNETTIALELPEISDEVTVAVPEKQSEKQTTSYAITMLENFIKFFVLKASLRNSCSGDRMKASMTAKFISALMVEELPDVISHVTAPNSVITGHVTGIPASHPVASETFHSSNDEQSTTTPMQFAATDEETSSSQPSASDALVTKPLTTITSELMHKLEILKISTNAIRLPQTIATDGSTIHENEFGEGERKRERVGEGEDSEGEDVPENGSLFVGDETLFSQHAIDGGHFGGTRSMTEFITPTETSEENFGVPGFSRIERLGPEATEEIHQTGIDAVTHSPSLDVGTKIRTGMQIDLTENSNKHRNGERASSGKPWTATNSFEETEGDISVIDDTFYHTDIDGATPTSKPITVSERKLQLQSTLQPEPELEPVPFPNNEVSRVLHGNSDSSSGFEPKPEPEFIAVSEDSKGSKNDLNGVSHADHTRTNDSHDAKGAYKTPFSFRLTNIDYDPEFGDPSSGKFKKLRDQLLPDVNSFVAVACTHCPIGLREVDLEEIFGSIFDDIFDGIHLMRFLKGSVIVDGVVRTSTKRNDMEQLATEFEQQITAKNSQIGGNDVDPRSIVLDGFVSKNYVERIHEGYTSGSTSSYIVGGGVAVGILAVLLIAFTVIATNNRRTNGTLKLKEENIAMADSNRSMWQNGTSSVNLMGYGNGRVMHGGGGGGGGMSANTQPPVVMVGSQMTAAMSAHHPSTHPIQPCA
ncbi:unnamed protein product [Litomosoides sigmodontis]|uniref:SEA domain-containing protein n=1 Tax=Litomosoides sigmodontis TaxID=42156 RepID=A0A3P6TU10_LITSI|nr:unnamed protein product [Litomosoides sigmodontis]